MSFSLAVQTAVFQRLNTYGPLIALVKGVYDNVPQPDDSGAAADFPYVTIGDDSIVEWCDDTRSGADILVNIHTWSRSRGRKETKTIQGHIFNALHRYDITVSGYHCLGIDFENDQSFLDVDGFTRHGVSVFRIIIDEV
jgi:hypothetical protein